MMFCEDNPINGASFHLAIEFGINYKGTILLSDLIAEPNGDVALEWNNESTGATFCMSFGAGEIHYSCIDEDDESTHGTVKYTGGEIPHIITECIDKVY